MPAHSRRVTERTHSPSPRPGWRPRGLVGLGDAFHEVAGDGVRVCSQLLLDDADIPHRVKTVHTRATLSDEVAAPIVREGYVEWLMNVPDPVPEELERGELGHVVVGSAQDIQVSRDRGEEALRNRRALSDSDRVDRAAHVDEVLFRALAGMVRPRTGIREGVERGVQGDQSLRALSLSSWKAIWQMILWPRSPHAHDGDGYIMLPSRMSSPRGSEKRA